MDGHKETIKLAIAQCLKVIKLYEWLLDLYVLDYFVDNHWCKLPAIWQEFLQDMDPKDLGDILTGQPTRHMIPLSFLALLKSVSALSLPRQSSYEVKQNQNDTDGTSNNHLKLKNLFLKHVKLKKRHEISVMAEFVARTARSNDCLGVLDFGSGLGHLVRILSYKYNLKTVGIEMQTRLTEQARSVSVICNVFRKLDLELEYTAKKYLKEECEPNFLRPTHCNVTLSSIDQLRDIPLPESMIKYGLVGLHPCGDLGPLLIKHFVNCDKVNFICVVGCCYMKLSCGEDSGGYPMSEYVKSLDHTLSFTSREIACHAIETYCERLCRGDYHDLKIHAYRATLEKLLVDLDPSLKHMPVRSIKHSSDMTFESYCSAAVRRLALGGAAAGGRHARRVAQWRRVVALYSLRLALAPLVESALLLDRLLYLLEHGISCAIYPAFDPKISPRNHIIIGRKL